MESTDKKATLADFVVPENAEFSVITVTQEEADEFATEEITDDELRALGFDRGDADVET